MMRAMLRERVSDERCERYRHLLLRHYLFYFSLSHRCHFFFSLYALHFLSTLLFHLRHMPLYFYYYFSF